ncbi:hypothetical protein LAZ67_2000267 [Cordylochernes scorpioides]|uniref:Reverse transcriptase domain-containing protein n=1 Tax=Cordylochernes scorpioides TaxID=51811 RepID=A0ABY6K3J0_9ARAC|nr:hypothetical protein LAZ67_2000267 [Cordylochernes scorpioides]
MAISEPKSAHLREVLLFAFNWKKSATEAHRMLEEVYSDHPLSKSQCYRWFKKFQSGDFELDNEPHGKPPQKHEKKSFLHRIVTSDEKWIHFSNLTRQKSWGLLGQFPKQTPRPNRFGKKAMLCIWWDQTGVVYFELLKPGKMVNTSRYEQQMRSLREALNEKRPEWREKHNNLILQHDNAPAHNATLKEKYLALTYYEDFNLLSDRHNGFRRSKSTITALTEIIKIALKHKTREYAAIIAVDISAAFDNAWWPALMKRLDEDGVQASTIKLLQSYFDNRRIRFRYSSTEINKKLSKGCPQGGPLSPTLWNILINEILNNNLDDYCETIGYADDITLICWNKTPEQLRKT